MANIIRGYTPAQAGRIIDARLTRIERNGLRGRASFERLIRPGNIAAQFGVQKPVDIEAIEVPLEAEAVEVALPQSFPKIELPEMMDMGNYGIMKEEVTVGLFKQVMKGYKIVGHCAKELKIILADPRKENDALTYVSLYDASKFAERLSKQTGRDFRVLSEREWELTSHGLSGENWTWTSTPYDGNTYVLRRLRDDESFNSIPEYRYPHHAIRLVEDL